MFEKTCMILTLCLMATFSGIYYYRHGTTAPQECLMLANDYQKLVNLLEDKKHKKLAFKFISQAYLYEIKSAQKNYQALMKKRFKRHKIEELKTVCLQMNHQVKLREMIQILGQYQTKI